MSAARHRRAADFVARGLYRNLLSFHDLENRIAALPEELDRGDAFEVFIEAYLSTTRVFQIAELWPVGQVPLDVRRTLNLPADAKGIDGVLRTKTGLDVPYQAKFRIGRPLLGFAEVAPFLGVTERAADRLLVSNADTHAADIVNRDGLRLMRGTDFDALTPEDFTAIDDWLEARPAVPSRAIPRADQLRALAQIDRGLGRWCRKQRGQKTKDGLSPERIARLNDLGFVWDPLDAAWDEMYSRLAAYKAAHDDCNVPQTYPADLKLGYWCTKQRTQKAKERLATERIARLDALGFVWEPRDAAWDEMYRRVAAYKADHGNRDVPEAYPVDGELGRWCRKQRQRMRLGTISPERTARLETLGFAWRPHDAAWDEMYNRLAAYRAGHENCYVTESDDPRLSSWCEAQRAHKKNDRLAPERVAQLDRLGFAWEPWDTLWNERYKQLVTYWQQHGDCLVPAKLAANLALGKWVTNQRAFNRQGTLSSDRKARLDALGFGWEVKKRRSQPSPVRRAGDD